MLSPDVVASLQRSTQINSRDEFRKYQRLIDEQQTKLLTLRGLLDFRWAEQPVPLDEVEPATEIVKRFSTGAMSFGSISKEAHDELAGELMPSRTLTKEEYERMMREVEGG